MYCKEMANAHLQYIYTDMDSAALSFTDKEKHCRAFKPEEEHNITSSCGPRPDHPPLPSSPLRHGGGHGFRLGGYNRDAPEVC